MGSGFPEDGGISKGSLQAERPGPTLPLAAAPLAPYPPPDP